MQKLNLLLLGVTFVSIAHATQPGSATPRTGVAHDAALSSAVEHARYGVALDGAASDHHGRAFFAHNPVQSMNVHFSADGVRVEAGSASRVRWQWKLRLHGVGYGNRLVAPAPARVEASGNEVQLRRGTLVEWYRNTPAGVEQGFTLNRQPAGARRDEHLRLALGVTGGAHPELDGAGVVRLRDTSGATVARYEKLAAWDARGRVLPARLEVAASANEITLAVDDARAVYPVTIDPLIVNEEAKLLPPIDPIGGHAARMGAAVAIDGDTAIIGAPHEDTATGSNAGKVYVFVRSGTTWTQQTTLFPDDPTVDDNFGTSVAISGNTALISSAADDITDKMDVGSAYVFVRSGTTWSQQQHLFASDADAFDYFGTSVALDGNTALIGAPRAHKPDGTDETGAAYVFIRTTTTWTQQAKFSAADSAFGDKFGTAVALSGNTALVGAPSDTTSAASFAGSASVFIRSGTTWTQSGTPWSLTVAHAFDSFGSSVALSGTTAVVGVPQEDTTLTDVGGAYVFTVGTTGGTRLFASDAAAGDNFGAAVAIAGNVAVVGATKDDTSGGSDAGSAYAFVRSGTTWSQQSHLFASDGGASDQFGSAIAFNGDTALIGAPLNDLPNVSPTDFDAGTTYVFRIVNDVTPAISLTDPRALPEGSAAAPGSTTFNVKLSEPTGKTVTVTYKTTDGVTNGAKAGSDYVAKSGTLTFAPGQTSKTVTVTFIGDSVAELNEPFFLDLKTPTNATIADSRGVAYIKNDDGPSITIDNALTVNEGSSGTTPQTFTVHLSASSTNTITVDWATANGTAGPADYTVANGTLTFAPGETQKTITVLVKGDTTVEPTETYKVNLAHPAYSVLADSQGVGYIRNDDTAAAPPVSEDAPSQ